MAKYTVHWVDVIYLYRTGVEAASEEEAVRIALEGDSDTIEIGNEHTAHGGRYVVLDKEDDGEFIMRDVEIGPPHAHEEEEETKH